MAEQGMDRGRERAGATFVQLLHFIFRRYIFFHHYNSVELYEKASDD